MRKISRAGFLAIFASFALAGAAIAATLVFKEAHTGKYDPAHTFLVQAVWQEGIGCPTNASTTPDGVNKVGYTDPACTTGDQKDDHVSGVLLAKTGPTSNFAEPFLTLKDITTTQIHELGYDIRKPTGWNDPRGSQCSSDGPTFQLVKGADVYYVACSSPPPDGQTVGNGWLRLTWGTGGVLTAYLNGVTPTNIDSMTFDAIYVILQAGQDEGPENFGLAVLDNIDVNGVRIGKG